VKTKLHSILLLLLLILFWNQSISQTISSLAPSSGISGQVIDVIVRGVSTNFKNGFSRADFGAGITVEKFSVLDLITGIATINISSSATIGFRRVIVTTNNEIASLDNAFEIFNAGGNVRATIQVLPVETISLSDFDLSHPQNSPTIFFINVYNDNTDRKVKIEVYLSSQGGEDLLKLYLLNKELSPNAYIKLTNKDFDHSQILGKTGNDFLNDIKAKGTFPPGNYTYKLLVKDEQGNILAQDETTTTVINPNANPELITPGTLFSSEIEKVFIPQPLFQWFGQNDSYDFALYKLTDNESPEDVVRNLPVFHQEDIRGNNFLYPLYAEKLIEGQKYAWQIQAKVSTSSSFQYLPSEVFQFIYQSPSASDSAVAKITITPEDIELTPGQQYQFNAMLLDKDNKPITNIKPVWQLTPNKGTITQDGLYTAGNDNTMLAVLVKSGIAAEFAVVTIHTNSGISGNIFLSDFVKKLFGLP
jgi:hypothetical protein